MSWASSRGELPEQSTIVRGRPASAAPVVTQLVTEGGPAGQGPRRRLTKITKSRVGIAKEAHVGDPVKVASLEVPIPEDWRPTLKAVVDSLVRRDAVIGAGLPSVDPVPAEISQRCLQAVDGYAAVTLITPPDESWNASVALWFGDHWRCLVDLWTEEEGRSDLVLDVDVFEHGPGYRYRVNLVYVP